MFKKKARLARVSITFLEGGSHGFVPPPIEVLLREGETFRTIIGGYQVYRSDGQLSRHIDPVAGFTTDIMLSYV